MDAKRQRLAIKVSADRYKWQYLNLIVSVCVYIMYNFDYAIIKL